MREWDNPHNDEYIKNLIIIAAITSTFFFILAWVSLIFEGYSYGFYGGIFVASIIIASFIWGIILNEFILRPKKIKIISEEGVVLVFQWHRIKTVPWHRIRNISSYIYLGNPEKYYSQKEAKLAIIGKHYSINICQENAERIKSAYKNATGQEIPIKYID